MAGATHQHVTHNRYIVMTNAHMEVREATAEDYEAIVRLVPTREELFLVYPKGIHPFSVSQIRALADVRNELTVAVHSGEVIGFANLYDLEPGQWAFIGNVVVSRAFRGQGLGRRLLKVWGARGQNIRVQREHPRTTALCMSGIQAIFH